VVGYVIGIALGLVLFSHPEFMKTRRPWALEPFDSRIMAAFPIMGGLWAHYAYLANDWAEIKFGVLGIFILNASLFVVWFLNLPRYDFARENVIQYGIITAALAVLLGT